MVNENVGSLVNTLTLYQHTDLRLEGFARQLSEEWDVSIFLDFLIAQNLCLQVCGRMVWHARQSSCAGCCMRGGSQQ